VVVVVVLVVDVVVVVVVVDVVVVVVVVVDVVDVVVKPQTLSEVSVGGSSSSSSPTHSVTAVQRASLVGVGATSWYSMPGRPGVGELPSLGWHTRPVWPEPSGAVLGNRLHERKHRPR